MGFGDLVVAIAPATLRAEMQKVVAAATMHYADH
jgi:hypothetical protein